MAERVVSPGVFTREKDLSFLPQGIDTIGAALIEPTNEGFFLFLHKLETLAEFEKKFGSESQDFYVPFTGNNIFVVLEK